VTVALYGVDIPRGQDVSRGFGCSMDATSPVIIAVDEGDGMGESH
jgi:hypothetical protein